MSFPTIRGSVMVPFSGSRESAIERATGTIMGYLETQDPRTLSREANHIHFTAPGFRWRFRGPGYASRSNVLDMISAGEIDVHAIANQLIVNYQLHFTPLYVLMILMFVASFGFLFLFREAPRTVSCLLWLTPLFMPAILGSNILIATSQFRRFLHWATRQWE
jgi:hypothetical protein